MFIIWFVFISQILTRITYVHSMWTASECLKRNRLVHYIPPNEVTGYIFTWDPTQGIEHLKSHVSEILWFALLPLTKQDQGGIGVGCIRHNHVGGYGTCSHENYLIPRSYGGLV